MLLMREQNTFACLPRSTDKALTGPQLDACWRCRIGGYRIICDIQDAVLCMLVIEVGNRRDVYR